MSSFFFSSVILSSRAIDCLTRKYHKCEDDELFPFNKCNINNAEDAVLPQGPVRNTLIKSHTSEIEERPRKALPGDALFIAIIKSGSKRGKYQLVWFVITSQIFSVD